MLAPNDHLFLGLQRCWCAAAIWTALVLVGTAARAQSIDVPVRMERQEEFRRDEQKPNWINRADCLADDILAFETFLTGSFFEKNLEVWAGASEDCSTLENRTGRAPRCWLVYQQVPDDDQFRVEIRAQDIAARNRPSDRQNGPGSGTAEDCEQSGLTGDGLALTLWFMFVDSDDTVLGTAGKWEETGIDLVGPNPPTQIEAGPGENSVFLDWEGSTSALTGYNIYCEASAGTTASVPLAPLSFHDGSVLPGVDSGVDASTVPAGGTGGAAPLASDAGSVTLTDGGATTTGINPECPSSTIVGGEVPPPDLAPCGDSGSQSTGGRGEGLVNGTSYAVAVAGVDLVGNVGPLSEVQCATPQVVDSFYELYRRAGGKGGGGFCSIGRPSSSRAVMATGLLLALAFAFRRRR